jgi:rod shape determining protein RodA
MLKKLDWFIIAPLLVIFSLGALILFSIDPLYFYNHIGFFLFGLLSFILLTNFDYRVFRKFHLYLYLASIFLLLLPFVLGRITRGTSRWITIFGFTFQPSEFVKPLLILVFSSLALSLDLEKLKNVLSFFLFLFLPFLLIFKQPDFGNALVIFAIWLCTIIARGLKKKYIFLGIIVFFALIPVGWRILKPYQQERVVSFLNPQYDSLGIGYNLIQSKIAVGSGGLVGKGLGEGSQSQLRFLPERHSDFIFACLAEELGFIGASLLILSFFVLISRIVFVAQRSADLFGNLICMGAATVFFFQTVVNIGMNLGLVPVTGLTLPFVSYGGSSLVSSLILLGLVQSVAKRPKREEMIEIS